MNRYCSDAALSIDHARPGDRLAPLVKQPTEVDVVLFCAAIRNYHRYHYDHVYTRSQGIDGIIVPGFLMGNWCIEAAARGFSEPVHIRQLRFKNKAVAQIGGAFNVNGEVTSTDQDEVGLAFIRCRFAILDASDRLVTTGEVDVVGALDAQMR